MINARYLRKCQSDYISVLKSCMPSTKENFLVRATKRGNADEARDNAVRGNGDGWNELPAGMVLHENE